MADIQRAGWPIFREQDVLYSESRMADIQRVGWPIFREQDV